MATIESRERGYLVKRSREAGAETGRDPKADTAPVEYVIGLVSGVTGVPLSDIWATHRKDARTARARQLSMYLISVAWQWPLYRIGAAFGRDRTTVGHACRRIEDLRDDRQWDEQIERLEACLQEIPAGLALSGGRAAR
nr:helix-turn-helix domain-containing protein [Asticcacaulis currens]